MLRPVSLASASAQCLCALPLATLGLSACLITPNPDFGAWGDGGSESGAGETTTDAASDTGESNATTDAAESDDTEDCAEGILDCEPNTPGCQSLDTAEHCGVCGNTCEFLGQALECEAGTCVGEVLVTGFKDAYTDINKADEPFGTHNDVHVEGGDTPEHAYLALPNLAMAFADLHAELLAARLVLSFDDGPEDELHIHRVLGPWDENSITWNSAPEFGPLTLEQFSPAGEVELDVHTLFPTWPHQPASLVLISTAEGNGGPHNKFPAHESGMGPRLFLTVSW